MASEVTGPGSPRIQQFLNAPMIFMGTTCVSSDSLFMRPLPATGGSAKIVERGDTFDIKFAEAGESNSVPAYFLGYAGGAQKSPRPKYVDIPKHGVDGNLLFTGSLSGCSLVVTELPGGEIYRVFHDSRQNSSVLHDNVVMAVDFMDVAFEGKGTGLGSAFMQYKSGQWTIYSQLQNMNPYPLLREMPEGESPVFSRSPGSYDLNDRIGRVEEHRHRQQQELLQLAQEVKVVAGDNEGEFEPGKISEQNDGIRKWQKLREDILDKNFSVKSTLVNWKNDLYQKINDPKFHPGEKTEMKRLHKELDYLIQANLRKFDPTLKESSVVDFTWLWLREKEARGIGEVVRLDQDLKTSMGDEIAQRYSEVELDMLHRTNSDFAHGFDHYKDIHTGGHLTAMEMKRHFLRPQTTDMERGALIRKIGIAEEREFRSTVWGKTEVVVKDFQHAGGSVTPMPQDLFLKAVGDKFGGRCYPLVRAMAVAHATGGLDELVEKIFTSAAKPTSGEAHLFKESLNNLHANYEAASVSTPVGRVGIRDVMHMLRQSKGRVFALNTAKHSMMVGTIMVREQPTWVFYDPNFAIARFTSEDAMHSALNRHFVDRKFAGTYGAFGSSHQPTFNLVAIEPEKMARVPVGNGLTVDDLSSYRTLVESIDVKKAPRLILPVSEQLARDREFRAGESLMESSQWGDRWQESTKRLVEQSGLGEHWMPVLASIRDREDGHSYEIQFINRENLDDTRWINTEDPVIKEFAGFLDGHFGAIRKGLNYENGEFKPRPGVPEAESIDGLNSAFVIQTLIGWANGTSVPGGPGGSSDLAIALTVHSYLNLTQMAYTTLGDVGKMINLVKTIMRSEEAAQATVSAFSKTLSRVAGVAGEGVGIVFGGLSVGLDAYELAHAENDIQRAIFGTQLGFDATSLAVGLGSLGAGLVGASSAAAVLGGAGVILGGLAIGFGALAEAFGKVTQDAQAVGQYFAAVDDAYGRGGYTYDAEQKVLVPIPRAVVKKLNLRDGRVDFDSQYIYRTRHGSTGSGRINYFFWAGDSPSMVNDRSQAINVREGILKQDHSDAAKNNSFTALILPCTPKSYISYQYEILAGATTRHDQGFDIIRRLEQDERFDYDFYVFPSEKIIRNIQQEYVGTPVTVVLDERPMRLEVPQLPNELKNLLSYTLLGDGGAYTIGLNTGVEFTLSVVEGGRRTIQWILDIKRLGGASVTVLDDRLTVAGITINIPNHTSFRVLILGANNEISEVDFTSHDVFVVAEDTIDLTVYDTETLTRHLSELARQHRLHVEFVVINNYVIGYVDEDAEEDFIRPRRVGRAYYEVGRDRMLYTDDDNLTVTGDAELIAVIDNDAYFYNTACGSLWRVDAGTHECLSNYCALYQTAGTSIIRVWKEDNTLFAAYRHELGQDKKGELIYAIVGDKMTLVSIVGDHDLLQHLDQMDRMDGGILRLLGAYDNGPLKLPIYPDGVLVHASDDAQMVNVFGEDGEEMPHRYWLRKRDGAVIKSNLPRGDFASDLVFAGSLISDEDGREIFYFYTRSRQIIYRQIGSGSSAGQARVVAFPENFAGLSNMFNVGGELFVSTQGGCVLRLTAAGVFFLEAVNSGWFNLPHQSPWWQDLQLFADANRAATVSVLDVKDLYGAIVPVWYHSGNFVISSLHGKQLQLFGVHKRDSGGMEAWVCHWDNPQSANLYTQPLLRSDELGSVFSSDGKLIAPYQIPEAQPILGGYHITAVAPVSDGLQVTTSDGVILVLGTGSLNLVAVNTNWQEANRNQLDYAMELLAKTWSHSEVVILQGPAEAPAAWYNIAERQVLRARGVTWASNPVWLGMSPHHGVGLIHLQSNGDLYRVRVGGGRIIGSYKLAQRYGKTLVLSHPNGSGVLFPMPVGAEFAMVAASNGGHHYSINQGIWDHYKALVIDDQGTSQAPLEVNLVPEISEDFLTTNVDGDCVLLDTSNGKSLTICKAFGTDQGLDNTYINTTKAVVTMRDIERAQIFMGNLLQTPTIPGVTLGYVAYYNRFGANWV